MVKDGIVIKNKRTGLRIVATVIRRQKTPSLLIGDELGVTKVASFKDWDAAEDFMEHVVRMTKLRKEEDG